MADLTLKLLLATITSRQWVHSMGEVVPSHIPSCRIYGKFFPIDIWHHREHQAAVFGFHPLWPLLLCHLETERHRWGTSFSVSLSLSPLTSCSHSYESILFINLPSSSSLKFGVFKSYDTVSKMCFLETLVCCNFKERQDGPLREWYSLEIWTSAFRPCAHIVTVIRLKWFMYLSSWGYRCS